MSPLRIPDDLAQPVTGGSILLVVLDGLGGLPAAMGGPTELEAARTPHLDALAARSSLGMLLPVAPGVTPGSGPAHLALFGYDPTEYVIGRGILSALGVGFDLERGDVGVRLNLATLDGEGRVVDRRAGRPSDEEGRRITALLQAVAARQAGAEIFLLHEKEHRVVLVLRGEGLEGEIADTDPQREGVRPLDPEPLSPGSARTAGILKAFFAEARTALADEASANGVLARGIASYHGLPSMDDRFKVGGLAVAAYPMYRGVARLVGMEVPGTPASDDASVSLLEERFGSRPFHFLHFKAPDARGEDGDFDAKAKAIETIDAFLPRLTALEPDVLIVTGDHSTPASMSRHSWHHVPLLIASKWARPTAPSFSESACRGGDLGVVESRTLMNLALAHAGRLAKFGA